MHYVFKMLQIPFFSKEKGKYIIQPRLQGKKKIQEKHNFSNIQ
jgi:hypothetical protein